MVWSARRDTRRPAQPEDSREALAVGKPCVDLATLRRDRRAPATAAMFGLKSRFQQMLL